MCGILYGGKYCVVVIVSFPLCVDHYVWNTVRWLILCSHHCVHWHCVAVLKKVKHKVVEGMNSNTADALGLSRAILCNGESA